MTAFERKLAQLRADAADLDPRLVVHMPKMEGFEPPLFVNTGRPPETEEEIERLLAQDAG